MLVFERILTRLLEFGVVSLLGGIGLAVALRLSAWRWTWGLLGFGPAWVMLGKLPLLAVGVGCASFAGCVVGVLWHAADLAEGGDRARAARARLGIVEGARRVVRRRRIVSHGWVHDGWLCVGHDEHGSPVSIAAKERAGSHALIVGATGSGKTVSQAWIATRLIAHGHGAVAIDPKGDGMLREELRRAAKSAGREFLEWTPRGPCAYNPYATGSDSQIADKALAGEVFTEPHYRRTAQRYLGHAVRAMRAAGIEVTAARLMEQLDPDALELTARKLPEEQAAVVHEYLDSLSEPQRRGLAGTRDRLSILPESDAGRWLDPDKAPAIGLRAAIESRAVVYFALESDRMPLLAQMLGVAIVCDLVAVATHFQNDPMDTVVLVDEFSAIGAGHVARLFARARGAGMSLLLATQEFADLRSAGEGLREQVVGNLDTLIAHRQNVPSSAELVADIAGSRPEWVTTQATAAGLFGQWESGRGSRRRDYEREVHPSSIMRLSAGQALVVAAGGRQRAVFARMCHPRDGTR
jgi:conjugal transfer pilus assembly protein TraD